MFEIIIVITVIIIVTIGIVIISIVIRIIINIVTFRYPVIIDVEIATKLSTTIDLFIRISNSISILIYLFYFSKVPDNIKLKVFPSFIDCFASDTSQFSNEE